MTPVDAVRNDAAASPSDTGRRTVVLSGCRADPLGSYLQGLGVWRAIRRLADPDVEAYWRAGTLTLVSTLDADGLVEAILERFGPLPIVSPWNAGSGFAGNGKSKEAEKALAAVESGDDPRLAVLRDAVASARAVVREGRARGWGGKGDRLWDDALKSDVVRLCRNRLPDESLAWLDTAIATTQDTAGRPTLEFSRLVGTGGNFGRQDLQATYVQRALTVLTDPRVRDRNPGWIRGVLFGRESTPYLRGTVGQFDPGRAGGIQSSPAEKADSDGFANPWALLFTLEGALFFAGATVRRLGVRSSGAALPFVVRASNVGYGSRARDENVTAEVWAPQWGAPATVPEIEHLFGRARIDWNGGPARSGLDVARAVVSGGVDRGLTRFERYALAERLGQNPLAVHVGTVAVTERPGPALTATTDRWLSACRRLGALPGGFPRSIDAALEAAEEALYATTADGAASLVAVLTALGRLHRAISISGRARGTVPPLTLPDPHRWIETIDHAGASSPDVRLAVALASGADDEPRTAGERIPPDRRAPLRALLTPIVPGARPGWSGRPAPITDGDVLGALAEVHRRRAYLSLPEPAAIRGRAIALRPAVLGHRTGFDHAVPAPLDDVLSLLDTPASGAGPRSDLADLLHGLMLFDWTPQARGQLTPTGRRHRDTSGLRVPPLFALLAPFYALAPYAITWRENEPTTVLLRPGGSWPAQLAAGQFSLVAADAARRLTAAGARTVIDPSAAARQFTGHGTDAGRCLAAALLVPLGTRDRRDLLGRVVDAHRVSLPTPARPGDPDEPPSTTDPHGPDPYEPDPHEPDPIEGASE